VPLKLVAVEVQGQKGWGSAVRDSTPKFWQSQEKWYKVPLDAIQWQDVYGRVPKALAVFTLKQHELESHFCHGFLPDHQIYTVV